MIYDIISSQWFMRVHALVHAYSNDAQIQLSSQSCHETICPSDLAKKTRKVDSAGLQQPLQYRYQVKASAQVNSFRPKEIGTEDKMNLRPQMLGAVFHNHYTDIPRASHCGIIWEAESGMNNYQQLAGMFLFLRIVN